MGVAQGEFREQREANVLLELRMAEPMSEEVLDAYSDHVVDALAESAREIALGPAVALNPAASTIKLRFDVLGSDDAEIHKQVSEVLAVIERETGLILARSHVAA